MKFEKNQLVAVRDGKGCRPDCRKWHLRRYLRYDSQIKRHAVVPVNGQGGAFAWDECVPARKVWPKLSSVHGK